MQSRSGWRLAAAALVLCVPTLGACGFDNATDRPYTQADGINYRHGSVFVLNAVIASAQADSGTMLASFSNQSDTATKTISSVAGAEGNTITANDFTPIDIKPMGFVNLADDDSDAITVTGSFSPGDVLPVSITLGDGSVITMDVPVVYACEDYAGLDVSQASASAAAVTDVPTAVPTDGGTRVPPTTAPTAVSPITPSDVESSASSSASAETSTEASSVTSATASPSVTGTASSGTSSASPSVYSCGDTPEQD